MAKAADIGSKRIISLTRDAWVKWVTQRSDVVARDILSSEFQWLSRDSDLIIKVSSPSQGEFLLLNEIQLRYDSRMPKRIRAYAALAEEKYDLPVYPVVLNILPPTSGVEIKSSYESNLLGIRALQEYRVINLWEVDVNLAFQPELKTLIPFAPVLRGGGEESVVRRALQVLESDEQLTEARNLLGYFATLVLRSSVVQEIMRWDRAMLRELTAYEEILQEGRQEGMQEGSVRMLLRILQSLFGEVPDDVRATLLLLSAEQLEELVVVAVRVNSLDEFIASIPPVTAENG